MSVKIRLARRGRKKRPFYHVVIADARAPRDGKFIEQIGSYNPMTVPASIELDRDKAYEWLMKGAQPTDTVRALLKFKGVYYRKHLMRGVAKGAFSEEKAMEMYQEWIDKKEAAIAARKEDTARKKADFWKMVSGEIKPAAKSADKEAGEAFRENDGGEASAEEAAPAESAEETAPVAEEKKEEAPAAVEEAAPVAAAPVAEEPKPADDLTKIEGIGPAISKLLAAQGIVTFADLGGKSSDDIKAILDAAEGNFAAHDPGTWPKQAQMAADGKWDELKKWQDELDGGKVANASEEE